MNEYFNLGKKINIDNAIIYTVNGSSSSKKGYKYSVWMCRTVFKATTQHIYLNNKLKNKPFATMNAPNISIMIYKMQYTQFNFFSLLSLFRK